MSSKVSGNSGGSVSGGKASNGGGVSSGGGAAGSGGGGGGGAYISRPGFESNPKGYFSGLHGNQKGK
ncbi:hypothetical protein ACJIZ3_019626 [Penstemon smallii]|uniref:Uncharacterized protein n=1 Tax=Penstemon smallii TaxID=265156 RepID=A0ABD3T1P6_9LAMI